MKKCQILSVTLFVIFLFPSFITAASPKTNSKGDNGAKKASEYVKSDKSPKTGNIKKDRKAGTLVWSNRSPNGME